jgi:hypothetical protein
MELKTNSFISSVSNAYFDANASEVYSAKHKSIKTYIKSSGEKNS